MRGVCRRSQRKHPVSVSRPPVLVAGGQVRFRGPDFAVVSAGSRSPLPSEGLLGGLPAGVAQEARRLGLIPRPPLSPGMTTCDQRPALINVSFHHLSGPACLSARPRRHRAAGRLGRGPRPRIRRHPAGRDPAAAGRQEAARPWRARRARQHRHRLPAAVRQL